MTDNLRRLHLTGVQFYDWAYRHADLLGGGETYDDALQKIRRDLQNDAALQAAFGAEAELDKWKRILEAQALLAKHRAMPSR